MCSILSAHWQGRGAALMQILLMQQSKHICRCKMQLFPWYFHLPCHSPFFSPAIRPCTVEDSAFTYVVNCTMGSSLAAELLHSALFSLPPCYFGAYPPPFSSTYLGSLNNLHILACFATPKALCCKFSQLHWNRACSGTAAWLLLLRLHCRCLTVLLVNALHTFNLFSTEHGLTQVWAVVWQYIRS